jgi:pimeloyl-ACP methyl ester carboxylesterase
MQREALTMCRAAVRRAIPCSSIRYAEEDVIDRCCSMPTSDLWQSQLGAQRDWVWRGWQIRYTFIRARQTEGGDVPVLFLHGFASALTQWRSNLMPISQFHTVYAIDLVGFGASEKAAASYNVALWVEQVYDFWRTLIGRPVVIVGHSLGALVALTAAATHPDMVQGLALITLPAARQELLSGQFQAIAGRLESWLAQPLLIRPIFSLLKRRSVLRSVLKMAYTNVENITEELVESFALPALDRGAARVFCRLSQARTRADFSQETRVMLPQVKAPILLMWGAKDRIIPLTWGRQLKALHTDLKLIEIPEAGHCLYDECFDRVNHEVLQWIRHQVQGDRTAA